MGRTKVLVTVATAGALLVAVVAVRGDTAAVEADLAAPPEPVPSASEAPVDGLTDGVLVAANGIPGMRLGAAPGDSQGFYEDTPAGCRLVWDEDAGTSGSDVGLSSVQWESSAWVVDGRVVSVFLGSWSEADEASQDLRTWLGPTLGSPLEAAQELPGARSVVERPLGADGPSVTVVTVPGRGVEVVYSDALQGGFEPGPRKGRITTLEVRRPEARVCTFQELDPFNPSQEPVTLDIDGVAGVRLGTPVEEMLVAENVTSEGLGPPGCRSFSVESEQGWVRAIATSDVVTELQVFGRVATTFGLPAGADTDQVRAAFPELADRSDEVLLAGGQTSVQVDGVDIRLDIYPGTVWVPDVERPVTGGPPVVQGITLRTVGEDLASC